MDNIKIDLIRSISNDVTFNENVLKDAVESNHIDFHSLIEDCYFINDEQLEEYKNKLFNLLSFGYNLGFNSAKEKCITIITQTQLVEEKCRTRPNDYYGCIFDIEFYDKVNLTKLCHIFNSPDSKEKTEVLSDLIEQCIKNKTTLSNTYINLTNQYKYSTREYKLNIPVISMIYMIDSDLLQFIIEKNIIEP